MCPPVHPCSARSVLLPECVAVATPGGTGSDRRKPIPQLYCCSQVSSAFCWTRTRPRPVSTPLHRNSPYLPPPPPDEVSWYFVLLLSMSFCVHTLVDAAAQRAHSPSAFLGKSRKILPLSNRKYTDFLKILNNKNFYKFLDFYRRFRVLLHY